MSDGTAKAPPHDRGAEASLLGAVLLDNKRLTSATVAALEVEHFYPPAHREIWRAMREIGAENRPIDAVTLTARLRELGTLKAAGGAGYLVQLSAETPEVANADHYARIVRNHAYHRDLLGKVNELRDRLGRDAADLDAAADLFARELRELRADRGPSDTIAEARTLADLGWLAEPPPLPEALVCWRESLVGDEPRPDHTLIPLGHSGLLIGAGGIGKSYATLDLALSVATGAEWLGTFPVPKPGRVLLVSAEDGAAEVGNRLNRIWRGRRRPGLADLAGRNLVVWPRAGKPSPLVEVGRFRGDVRRGRFAEKLRERLSDGGGPWSLVILDPAARLMGPDVEESNQAATRWVEEIEALIADLAENGPAPTVVATHHTTKTSRAGGPVLAEGARGSSALVDGVRFVLSLGQATKGDKSEGASAAERAEPIDGLLCFRQVKSNYGKAAEPVFLRRGEDGVLMPDGPTPGRSTTTRGNGAARPLNPFGGTP